MALTNAFYEAIKSGNVRRVRIMMKNSLLVDLTFNEFYEMEKAASSMKGLYDEHDGKDFVEDRSKWDDDYMNKIMVKVISNFSHERIEHIKDVFRYLRPVAKEATHQVEDTGNCHNYDNIPKGTYQEEKRRCQQNGDYLYAKIGIGAVAGAAVGGAIASIASAPISGIIGGIAIGAVVGGAATTVVINGGKSK